MKSSKCQTCDRVTQNLLTANCNHRICFNCVKNNRNTHKCSMCAMSSSKNKLMGLSPMRKQRDTQRTAKPKSIQSQGHGKHGSHYHQQSQTVLSSPFTAINRSSRKTQPHIQSCSPYLESSSQYQKSQIKLLCKQHHEPLTLFSKSSKEAICSVCLCNKAKYKDEIMPIKGAEDFLRHQNRLERQESRVMLNEVQKSFKIIKENYDQFQRYYGENIRIVEEVFRNILQEVKQKESQVKQRINAFFAKKLTQCQEIQHDLNYLIQTLRTYREENKEPNTLTQSLYVYSSFKVIKKTMRTLNLNYIPYSNKPLCLLEYNKPPFDIALKQLMSFKEQLPLKYEELSVIERDKRRNKSASYRDRAGYSAGNSAQKKDSVYENLLNQKMAENRKSIRRYPQDEGLKKGSISNNNEFSEGHPKSHSNSMSSNAYHNNSTSSHNNLKPSSKSILSSSHFDYELKTPIKHFIEQSSSAKRESTFIEEEDSSKIEDHERSVSKKISFERSSNKKKSDGLNVVVNAVGIGSDLNDDEKSLYKRLLKSRFNKINGNNSNLVSDDSQIPKQSEIRAEFEQQSQIIDD